MWEGRVYACMEYSPHAARQNANITHALSCCVQHLSVGTSALCRGVALKAVCCCATAFDLGPLRQAEAGYAPLWSLLDTLLEGKQLQFTHP